MWPKPTKLFRESISILGEQNLSVLPGLTCLLATPPTPLRLSGPEKPTYLPRWGTSFLQSNTSPRIMSFMSNRCKLVRFRPTFSRTPHTPPRRHSRTVPPYRARHLNSSSRQSPKVTSRSSTKSYSMRRGGLIGSTSSIRQHHLRHRFGML